MITTYSPIDETSTASWASTSSSQASACEDYDWLVGRTVWVKWFLHKEDLWYKCSVHYGIDCTYVVQSTHDSIARFSGVYEFYPSGYNYKNEKTDHIWQLTYFNRRNNDTLKSESKKYELPDPGDVVMIKWTSWGTNPPWYCCVVREGNSKNCPLVVESHQMSESKFSGVYEFWPRGKDDKNESVDHIWERASTSKHSIFNRCTDYNKLSQFMMNTSSLQSSQQAAKKPFFLPTLTESMAERTQMERQNLRHGDLVHFKYDNVVYDCIVPANLPKNRLMDSRFPADVSGLNNLLKNNTSTTEKKKKKEKNLSKYKRMPIGPPPTCEDFVDFMIAREKLRINKMKYPDDTSKWTQDSILREFKFTNVKREHDRTTIVFRKITDSRKNIFRALSASLPQSHTKQDEKNVYESEIREAGLMAFNCCVHSVFESV